MGADGHGGANAETGRVNVYVLGYGARARGRVVVFEVIEAPAGLVAGAVLVDDVAPPAMPP